MTYNNLTKKKRMKLEDSFCARMTPEQDIEFLKWIANRFEHLKKAGVM